MQGIPKKERLEKSNSILVKYGLEGFARSYPHELSGGMRQRVALARAFLSNPDVLLMDEPFGALDAQTRFVLQEELLRIWRDDRKTILFVTHDIEEAIMLSDRILVLTDRPGNSVQTPCRYRQWSARRGIHPANAYVAVPTVPHAPRFSEPRW